MLLLAPTFGILRWSAVIAYDRYVQLPAFGPGADAVGGIGEALALARRRSAPGTRSAGGGGARARDRRVRRHARDPRSPPALNELAWLRATTADPAWRDTAEALRLSERALALSPRPDANALDTRAAALAAAGRFDEAVATAERAVALARSAHDDTLATNAAGRLAGYRRGRVFVQEGAPIH